MKWAFQLHEGIVRSCQEAEALIEVYCAPNQEERRELIEQSGLDSHDLDDLGRTHACF